MPSKKVPPLIRIQYPTVDPASLQQTLVQIKQLLESDEYHEAVTADAIAATTSPRTFAGLIDTPNVYRKDKWARSTSMGVKWDDIEWDDVLQKPDFEAIYLRLDTTNDPLTGDLTLVGKPTADLHATTKNYVGVSQFDPNILYVFDDLVGFEGTVYHCVKDVTPGDLPIDPLGNFFEFFAPIAKAIGAALQLNYKYTVPDNTGAVVGDNKFGVRMPEETSDNTVRVHYLTNANDPNPGNDVSVFWESVRIGDYIGFEESTGGTGSILLQVKGSPVRVNDATHPTDPDNHWYEIPCTLTAANGASEEDRVGVVSIVDDPNNRLPAGGLTDQFLRKVSDNSYDASWQTLVELDITDLDRIRWRGNFVDGNTYEPNDQALSNDYLAIANTQTIDDPAPRELQVPTFLYAGLTPTAQVTAKQVLAGQRYTGEAGRIFNIIGYRINTIVGNEYIVYSVDKTGGVDVQKEQIRFVGNVDGWVEFGVNEVFVYENTIFDVVVLMKEPEATPVTISASWNYTTPNNAATPASGTISHANKALDSLRVSKTPSAGGPIDLSGIGIGDIIQFGASGLRWSVQSVTDNGTWIDFSVAPAQQASPDGTEEFFFETTVAVQITYVQDTDYWLGDPRIQGLYGADVPYENLIPDDDQHNVDLLIGEVDLSPDWDVVAVSGGGSASAGGGTGATTFQELSDTPISYAGEASKTLAVKADETGVEFIVPPAGVTDHGALTGLADNDHPQYLQLTGALPMTGPLSINTTSIEALNLTRTFTGGSTRITFRNSADTRKGQIRINWDGGTFGEIDFIGPANNSDGQVLFGKLETAGTSISSVDAIVTKEKGDTRYLQLTGALPMTGLLTLSAAPTADLHAATKKYVDDSVPTVITAHSGLTGLSANDHPQYLLTAGGTITGQLNMFSGFPAIYFRDTDDGRTIFQYMTGETITWADAGSGTAWRATMLNVTMGAGDGAESWLWNTGPSGSYISMKLSSAGVELDGADLTLKDTNSWLFENNSGTSTLRFKLNNVEAARFREAGITTSNGLDVITREKGDARYLQSADDLPKVRWGAVNVSTGALRGGTGFSTSRIAVGRFRITFDTAHDGTNYAVTMNVAVDTRSRYFTGVDRATLTTTGFDCFIMDVNGVLTDTAETLYIQVMGGFA